MSSTELLAAWLRERYNGRLYVPLAALLFTVGAVGLGVAITPLRVAAGVALGYALVLAFRIWDDIVDRTSDAEQHPERVMALTPTVAPLVVFATGLAVGSVALMLALSRSLVGPIVVGGLGVVIAAWYAVRRRVSAGPLANAHVLMLKYPAIAIAANLPSDAAPAPASMAAALAALYFGLCVHEMLDDPTIRARPGTPWAVRIELAVLGALLLTLSMGGLTS